LAHAAIRAPGSTFIACDFVVNNDCPSAHRFYLIDGEPGPSYPEAKSMLLEAGFVITQELYPDCTGFSSPFLACQLTATRGADGIAVIFSEPGLDANDLGIAEPGKSIVEVRAYPLPDEGRSSY